MIPDSRKKLLVNEDWTKIYQSFKFADFKSYDFDTIRRVMISYLQENYPEDFNDYIESSEYIALIDLIAFLGQNLSFRIDLNARENFLETAQRRDSILKLAQLVSYNPHRNIPSSGLLKVTGISTTDNVLDSNGINLSDVTILWNDGLNPDWYQQFINIINSTLTTTFGASKSVKTIDGIRTESYSFNTTNEDVPLYNFSKTVNNTNMVFEVVSCTFDGKDYIYETAPQPGNTLNFVYRDDKQGSGSANTGFFLLFKQGNLSLANFSISNPVPNEIIGINTPNINETDVWLWQLNKQGNFETLWEKMPSVVGNNIIYNSISKSQKNLYAVTARSDDQIDLNFTDGVFGELPKGEFRLFYRQSNGLSYVIKPDDLTGITILVPYKNSVGQDHTLSVTLALQYTVSNSSATESDADIKLKAPQTYYLQNRMITAEDYNIGPLNAGSGILKVKSINRISSGISKYFDLIDVSGRATATNIFADDGILYKETSEQFFDFTFISRNQIFSVLKNNLADQVNNPKLASFYYDSYENPSLISLSLKWQKVNDTPGQSRGYFYNSNGTYKVGSEYTDNNLRYVEVGSKIKFAAPDGMYFDEQNALQFLQEEDVLGFDIVKFVDLAKGSYSFKQYYIKALNILPLYTGNSSYTTTLGVRYGLYRDPDYEGLKYWTDESMRLGYTISSLGLLDAFFNTSLAIDSTRALSANKPYWTVQQAGAGYSPIPRSLPVNGKSYIWSTVKQVINDGSTLLSDGTGPIILSSNIPSNAIPVEVVYTYSSILGFPIENEIANQCLSYRNFGLTINKVTRQWEFILNSNLDLNSDFSLDFQGNTRDLNLDSSWLIAFVWNGRNYRIRNRSLSYIFESEKQTAFYIDNTEINFDYTTNTIIKDKIDILPVNLTISSSEQESIGEDNIWQVDGQIIENDGFVDNRKVYVSLYDYNNAGEYLKPDSFATIVGNNYIYFKKSADGKTYSITRDSVIELTNEDQVTDSMKIDNQLFYFTSLDVIKYWSGQLSLLVYTDQYVARRGRSDLKFHYIHNTGYQRRIDPSKSNIIDIYMLTTSYDTDFRNFVSGGTSIEPSPPTSQELEKNYREKLDTIKSISDEIVFNSVIYKPLFGPKANAKLQAVFRAVRNPKAITNENDLKIRILNAVNEFFAIDNWEFGQKFYFTELSTYVMNLLSPSITNFIIVPKDSSAFGNLFEIESLPNEILISCAGVDDIEIIDAITSNQLSLNLGK